MENKYYTPSIEEFCVGFRYEIEDTWSSYIKIVFKDFTPVSIGSGNDRVPFNYKARVKYLDKADIEELGWIQTKEYSNETVFQFEIDDYLFYEITLQEDQIVIEKWYTQKLSVIPKGWSSVSVFIGTIKNYNELEKIMQMLNIK